MNSFGRMVRVTVFGESHAPAIGVVMDGLPAGIAIDLDRVAAFMARRSPGRAGTTPRSERDSAEILSGVVDGITCGSPLAAVIRNTDTRSRDYSELREKPRPMHADFPAWIKYGGANDIRGGGQFSARLTAPFCFAGAIAKDLLSSQGVEIGSHVASIGPVDDERLDPDAVDADLLRRLSEMPTPVISGPALERMMAEVESARSECDSIGGVIECAVAGAPAGLGEPLYESVESRIASAVFSIPAVRGVEFGAGFSAARMRGSSHNDAYIYKGNDIHTETNRHGGVLGGITTGMPIVFRAAFKPTPSIAREQRTVSLTKREAATLTINGRHDPCVVLRAAPVVEAAVALVLLDLLLESKGRDGWNSKSQEKK